MRLPLQITLVSLLLFGYACSSSKQVSSTIPVSFETSYYQSLPKNILRLFHLMKGSYVMQIQRSDSTGQKKYINYQLNDGLDSLVMVYKPVGDPVKTGYTLLSYTFLTTLPNEPLSTTLLKLEPMPGNRDTIIMHFYPAMDDLTLKEVVDEPAELSTYLTGLKTTAKRKKVKIAYSSVAHFIGEVTMPSKKEPGRERVEGWDISPKGMFLNLVQREGTSVVSKETFFMSRRNNIDLKRFLEDDKS